MLYLQGGMFLCTRLYYDVELGSLARIICLSGVSASPRIHTVNIERVYMILMQVNKRITYNIAVVIIIQPTRNIHLILRLALVSFLF